MKYAAENGKRETENESTKTEIFNIKCKKIKYLPSSDLNDDSGKISSQDKENFPVLYDIFSYVHATSFDI